MLRAALLLTGCCGLLPGDSCTPSGPPAPDSCSSGATGTLATIEIGNETDPFTAYHDGDSPRIIRGGQGLTMMGLRLRLTGDVPACLTQTTSYVTPASGSSSSPLKTYLGSDGSYTTQALWIPGSFPPTFTVRVEAGGKTQEVHLGAVDM